MSKQEQNMSGRLLSCAAVIPFPERRTIQHIFVTCGRFLVDYVFVGQID